MGLAAAKRAAWKGGLDMPTSTLSSTFADSHGNFEQVRTHERGIRNTFPILRQHYMTDRSSEAAALAPAELRRLLRATNIGELVSRYCTLEPTNTDSVLRGYCPLSSEERPLFFVLQSSQRFHCLGCGAAGDALNFLTRIHRVDETAAAGHLQRFLDTSRRDDIAQGTDSVLARTLIEVHADTARFYADQLRATPGALHYLSERGEIGRAHV
jgi:hypothetical protein